MLAPTNQLSFPQPRADLAYCCHDVFHLISKQQNTTVLSLLTHSCLLLWLLPGWGTSFHFAHRFRDETHSESIKRHEHYLALRLGLKPGDKVLDVGCGIGGPLREISLFSGAAVTGAQSLSFRSCICLFVDFILDSGTAACCQTACVCSSGSFVISLPCLSCTTSVF